MGGSAIGWASAMLYFDHNATTPLGDAAREAWLHASTKHWQNPSSLYHDAGFAAQQLDAARERLADALGCEAERLVFTGSATEANNALFASLPAGSRVLISAIEHPSVRAAARHWCGAGNVFEAPVDEHGIVQIGGLIEQHRPALVSVMAANNESGVLQPIQAVQAQCRAAGVRFHTDATQWIGKLPCDVLGCCDYVVGSAHKFGGPKGVGFLLQRDADEPLHFLRGGPQEQGRRAGTENYPAIEAMVTALEHTATGNGALRDAFEQQLIDAMPGVRIISAGAPRLWNTSLVVMPRHVNLKWLTRLSRLGIAISTGSACSTGREGSSVVVRALGATEEELRRVLRFSSGADTSTADWARLLSALVQVDGELAQS
jgi:cysteine desulfurase